MGYQMTNHANERADWLIDAVAAATQNRTFLRGDPEADDVVIAAIEMNARKAFSVISDRAEAAEADNKTLREKCAQIADAERMTGVPPIGQWAPLEIEIAELVAIATGKSIAKKIRGLTKEQSDE